MNSKAKSILGLLFLSCFVSASNVRSPELGQQANDRILYEESTKFAWDLFKNIEAKNIERNLIINPTTIQYLLTILSAAASSETERELCSLKLCRDARELETKLLNKQMEGNDATNDEYVTSSGIFIDQKIKMQPSFQNRLSQLNKVLVNSVNFSGGNREKTLNYINNWASLSTHGTIPQILDPSNDYSNTKLLLASAVYFKGIWKIAFKPSAYEDGFKLNEYQRIQVPYIYQRRTSYYGEVYDNKQKIGSFVELPYQNNQFSMFIILPEEGQPLNKLISIVDIQQIMSGAGQNSASRDVNVTLPKFEIGFDQSLTDSLKSMGLKTLFSSQASLPNLLIDDNAAISDIVQNAYISVDETGTRAGAVTTVSVIALSASEPEETIQFTVDRPFLAVVALQGTYQRTPLFICKVVNPSSSR